MVIRIARAPLFLVDRSSLTRLYSKRIGLSQPDCQCQYRRHLHSRVVPPPIPRPTPFVPDVATFLSLIGRGLSQHASKIESWDTLFRITSMQLRDLGVEPARNRKYLLRWRDKFRHGEFGIGGDAKYVGEGGAVECRVVEVQLEGDQDGTTTASLTRSAGVTRRVLNVPWTDPLAHAIEEPEEQVQAKKSGATERETPVTADLESRQEESEAAQAENQSTESTITTSRRPQGLQSINTDILKQAQPIQGVRFRPGRGIFGPHVRIVRGTHGQVGIIEASEGIWEHRRGHKVDGGERRKAEVRFKRRSAERRAARV